MNETNYKLAEGLVDSAYILQASQARHQREKIMQNLLAQRRMPKKGLDDLSIEHIVSELALMDSNNFKENVGVGEREARIFSSLVAKRHYFLGHGIGRSGDIGAVQPKAAGSSLMMQLTKYMALEAFKLSGVSNVADCLVVPLATGMAVTLTLLALRQQRPETAKFVLWTRIDQKSCLKAIQTAGYVPVVVPNVLEGDEVRTDLLALEKEITERGPDSILCVLSTTSCFAPRAPDRIVDIALMCKRHNIGHVVNNAYGVQASSCMYSIGEASRVGRVDAFVQSTDKNFMVPVGGAIIASTDAAFIRQVSTAYPGRASASPILDLFITFLSMGSDGYHQQLKDRKELAEYLASRLSSLAESHGERLLSTPHNPISFAISLSSIEEPTLLGSMLFSRCCSGTRVVPCNAKQNISGITLSGFGAHIEDYPIPYMTAACAIGLTKEEVDCFVSRLDKAFKDYAKKKGKKEKSK